MLQQPSLFKRMEIHKDVGTPKTIGEVAEPSQLVSEISAAFKHSAACHAWLGALVSGTLLAAGGMTVLAEEAETAKDDKAAVAEKASAETAKTEDGAKADEAAPEHLISGFAKWRQGVSSQGVDWNLQYLGEIIGNVSGGLKKSSIYEGLLKAGVTLDGDKLVGWKGSSLHVSGLYAHGRSPSSKLAGDILTLSNIDAYDSPRLFECWIQQQFFGDKLSLRAGLMGVDEEFAGTAYGGLFLHSCTAWPGIISLNSAAPAYPTAAPGVRLEYKPTERVFFRVGAFDGNPDPGDANGDPVNKYGVRFNLSEGAFLISETGFLWNQGGNVKGLPGTAKVGGWYHTEKFDDIRIDDTGLSLSDPLSSGVAKTHQGNWGLYLAAEQMVYREEPGSSQGLGLFGRLGMTPPNRNQVQYYLEGGAQYQGLIPGRNDDILGIACDYARMSSSTRGLAADADVLNSTTSALPDYEMALQVTYQIPIRAGWTVQPSAWFIRHPGGSSATHDSLLVGLRTILDF